MHFLLLIVGCLSLSSAKDIYYVRPTSGPTSTCKDCHTLSEYARETSRYFNSDNLTLVFLPGEHVLNTSIQFQLMASVTLLGTNSSVVHLPSRVVCDNNPAFSLTGVSSVEIRDLLFSSCGFSDDSIKPPTIDTHLGLLLQQTEYMVPAISANFVSTFHFIGCHMEHCHLPLRLSNSMLYLQDSRFESNFGYFGGAVAMYSSSGVLLGQNTFQNNTAELGGGVFARWSYLEFKGSTTLLKNRAVFGGGGICAIESRLNYNEDTVLESTGPTVSNGQICTSNLHTYVQNSARFGGGILLVLGDIKQENCTLNFTANSAENGGGLYGYHSSILFNGLILFRSNSAIINGSYTIVLVPDSNKGLGGAVHILYSNWSSTVAKFTGNFAVTGGGAVLAESSKVDFATDSSKFEMSTDKCLNESFAEVCIFTHTCLQKNSAAHGGALQVYDSIIEFNGNSCLVENSAFDKGGGILADFSELAFRGCTTFARNSASNGGGLLSRSGEAYSEGYTKFWGNSAVKGGGIEASNSSLILSGEFALLSNIAHSTGGGLYLINSTLNLTGPGRFMNNTARDCGGAICSNANTTLIFEGTNIWAENSAYYGGAVAVKEGKAKFSGENKFVGNEAIYGGAISTNEGREVLLTGKNVFVTNMAISIGYGGYGGGIHAVRTKLVLSGSLNFTKNVARYGGGLSVAQYDSKHFITFITNTSLLFFGNFAEKHGGAILVEDAPINYCASKLSNNTIPRTCFLKLADTDYEKDEIIIQAPRQNEDYIKFYDYVHTCVGHIKLEQNHANEGGNAIYGGALQKCAVIIPYIFVIYTPEPHQCQQEDLVEIIASRLEAIGVLTHEAFKQFNAGFYSIYSGLEAIAALMHKPLEQIIADSYTIASDAFRACICDTNGLHPNCIQRALHQSAYAGETIYLTVVAVGQANGIVPGVIHAHFTELEVAWLDQLQSTQNVEMTCSSLKYTLFAHDAGSAQLILSAEGPCGDSGEPLTVNVTFHPCPDGFTLSQLGSCECDHRLQKYTNRCDINSRAITRNSDFWVGVDSQSHGLILHPHCPFDYCTLDTVSFTLNSTDLQCANRRSGVLCGGCQSGLSLNLGSSRCTHCSNVFLLIIVPLAIGGLALVTLLFVCKVTVSAGTTNGLIFYANVLAVNQSLFFPSGETNILTVFIAWLNLDIGIKMCLFDGMDRYIWTWLQFIFPIYIWLLVCAITIATYHSTRLAKIIGPTNPVSVLAALFLLSYTKILRTIIAIFSFTTLDYPNDKSVTVWAYDGNIRYFHGKHIPLFLAGLLTFLFVFLPYTLLMLFGQCIVAGSNHKLLYWANSLKLRSFLDAHHAPYKNKHRYWTGLLLLLRFLLFIITGVVSINSPRDPTVNLLVLAIACAGLWTWTLNTGSMYKRWYNNVLESSFILNLAILSAASYQVRVEGGSQAAVVYISVSVAFVTFLGIIAYHVTERVKGSQTWRRYISPKIQQLLNKLPHQQHQQDSTVERVQPTAPPPPVTTTFIELREPLLESQQ